ncbi:MAG: hypothetical protein LLF83_10645 [Methanobacterium sp.]|nr:hypothetical protein [Methanobacterium sp.]
MKDKDEKWISRMDKVTSKSRAVGRIIIGIFAFLLWFFLGVPPTLIFSSGIQTFIGTVSFFIRNPVIFLLIGFINIFMGLIEYFYLQILWFSVFHFLWSIRFFYGYWKYKSLKKKNQTKIYVNELMDKT